MTAGPLAVFTPSVVDVAILEKLFVGRERVLDDLVQRATEAATTGTLAHRMIIGTRGAGKTHLMALAASRIGALDERVQVAWLSEDPWAVSDYEDLIREILDSLEIAPEVGEVGYPTVEQLEAQLAAVARSGGVVVVIAENFDEVFLRIKVAGQRRLRALIENGRSLLLLVSATKLTFATQQQDAPFYEFFSQKELAPFSVDEALEMVTRVREYLGDRATVDRLGTPSARLRFEAIDALAGGQPRMWSLLSGALDVDGIDELVGVLLTTFDELTPYYQGQLDRLQPAETKAVRIFARLDRAVSVKTLAREMQVTEKSASKTVSTLKAAGWVRVVESQYAPLLDQRMTFYELAEPLARIAFQLKETRNGGPIPLIVSFLGAWFTDEELSRCPAGMSSLSLASVTAVGSDPAREVHQLALRLAGSTNSMLSDSLLRLADDAFADLASGDAARFFGLPTTLRKVLEAEIRRVGLSEAWIRCHTMVVATSHWIPRCERLASLVDPDKRLDALLLLAETTSECGSPENAVVMAEQAIEEARRHFDAGAPQVLSARNVLAIAFARAGRGTDAIVTLESALEGILLLGPQYAGWAEMCRHNLAGFYEASGRSEDAIALFETLVETRAATLGKEHPETLTSMHNLAVCYLRAGELDRAGRLLEDVVAVRPKALGADHPDTLMTEAVVGDLRMLQGRLDEAVEIYQLVFERSARVLGEGHPATVATLAALHELRRRRDESGPQTFEPGP